MPDIITTWTVTLRRRLGEGEDPMATGPADVEHLLWALEEGEVTTSIDLVEP